VGHTLVERVEGATKLAFAIGARHKCCVSGAAVGRVLARLLGSGGSLSLEDLARPSGWDTLVNDPSVHLTAGFTGSRGSRLPLVGSDWRADILHGSAGRRGIWATIMITQGGTGRI
jgi:hypothetical protein